MTTPNLTYRVGGDAVRRVWSRWPLLTLLTVLLLGPLIAPLFQATRLWLVADTGALARNLLATYICPTPAKSYELLGYPMAVCTRCWGATIGLWIAWFAFRISERMQAGRVAVQLALLLNWYQRQFWLVRLALTVPPFVLWVAEIRWWASAPLWLLLLNGAFAGFAAGLLFCSLWPGLHNHATLES